MSLELPSPIAAYFTADTNSEAVAQCFTDNAVVKDDGHTYNGVAAIKEWVIDYSQKYTTTNEPLRSEEQDGKTIVTSRVSGNFPGSPIELRYFFGIEGNKIAYLDITL
jgi:hypothetical protein